MALPQVRCIWFLRREGWSLHLPLLCSENWYFLISLSPAERPGAAEKFFCSYLILGNTVSNICENEWAGTTPSCHSHYFNVTRWISSNGGCGMKKWAPPSHFHIGYTNYMGGYVYQFSRLNSKKWDFGEPVIKNLQMGVSKLFRTTVVLTLGKQLPNLGMLVK